MLIEYCPHGTLLQYLEQHGSPGLVEHVILACMYDVGEAVGTPGPIPSFTVT
jgi:hypothetical protein